MSDSSRYVYDALYGRVQYPAYVWEILSCPEIQRLREVRLCNINSLCLTGGANINRYEHSLGAAYLALQCVSAWPRDIDEKTKKRIVLAALLHDLGTTAFGHSVQYVLDTRGYQHESVYDIITQQDGTDHQGKYSYQHARMEPIYFGLPKRLVRLIPDEDLKVINDIVKGKGPLAPLVNGTIDLDNLDNVYRLAYHIGLVHSTEVPVKIASAMWIEGGQLVIKESVSELLKDWYDVRRTLYRYLLLNPDEFSAKCMLEEALYLAQTRSSGLFSWNDVDYQLLEKLSTCSDEVRNIISRLMIGDLYGCIGIYSTARIESYDMLTDQSFRRSVEQKIEARLRKIKQSSLKSTIIAIHAIKDVNKTQRQITVTTDAGRQVSVGTPSHQVLIGVFFKNAHLSVTSISRSMLEEHRVSHAVQGELKQVFADSEIEELTLYGEAFSTDCQVVGAH
jgi:HD superfamily phosphohydrolase